MSEGFGKISYRYMSKRLPEKYYTSKCNNDIFKVINCSYFEECMFFAQVDQVNGP